MSSTVVVHATLALGRLAPGVSLESAQSKMSAVARSLALEYPDTNEGKGVRLVGFRDHLTGPVSSSVWLLLLGVSCGNVANLMMGRVITRSSEIAVRTALGADRVQIFAQLLWESLLLAACGCAVCLGMAWAAIRFLTTLSQLALPRSAPKEIDATVPWFSIGLSLLTGVILGTLPALYSTRIRPAVLGRDSVERGAGGGSALIRKSVVVGEIALAAVLLTCAGLLAESFLSLRRVESGIDLQPVLTLEVTPPVVDFSGDDDLTRVFNQVLDRVRQLPGVIEAGAINRLPMSGAVYRQAISRDDWPPPEPGSESNALMRAVIPRYFEALGIPVLQGRGISAPDNAEAPPVALMNASLSARLFPDRDPIGKRVTINRTSYKVIGVVADVRHFGLQEGFDRALYVPYAQETDSWLHRRSMFLTVRAHRDPLTVAGAVRAAIRDVLPGIVAAKMKSRTELTENTIATPRLRTTVMVIFAVAALLVTAVGIAALVAYSVSRRTSEIGLRMALGATRVEVMSQVVGQGLRLAVLGLSLGLLIAAAVARALSSLLRDVSPTEPVVYAGSFVLLLAVAVIASWVPAQRASRVDPLEALRQH